MASLMCNLIGLQLNHTCFDVLLTEHVVGLCVPELISARVRRRFSSKLASIVVKWKEKQVKNRFKLRATHWIPHNMSPASLL
jgi:hypothetical protein